MPIIPEKKAPVSRKQAMGATVAAPRPTSGPSRPTHGEISKRAYEIWLSSGCPQSCHEEHWHQAEKELGSGGAR